MNNAKGRDAELLELYDEPAWNNPVVRFLDGAGEDVLPRRDRVWELGPLASRMVATLAKAKRDAPSWLRLVADEAAGGLATETFSMACFWEGEVRLGGLEGVVHTTAGWSGGREVVRVRFDPERLPLERLREEAARMSCARLAEEGEVRSAKETDRKYHLRRSPLQYLPLTPMQRTKVNAALARGKEPTRWLSPRQAAMAKELARLWREDREALSDLDPPESGDAGELARYAGEVARLLL